MQLRDDEPDLPARIDIVPMIDVIFAILAFFILSSLSLTRSQGLPVNLPQAQTSQLQQQNLRVLITLRSNGELFVNREPASLADLIDQVQQLKGDQPEIVVVVNADTAVSHGQVVAVMDRLRQVEGARLAIATKGPGET
ncbi:MAG: biopolymer transporter ExbD [Synechococcales cyanobacterium RM1_1_8]|nr:biopolymer transporter ExbD [Synechococcales cyanobacterium RM1_1_8]